MNRFIKIGKAAEMLGVSVQTLRRWEKAGIIHSNQKIKGMTRYYDQDKLLGIKNGETDLTIAYARVSSHDQKDDLIRQAQLLSSYCIKHGWSHEVIQDLLIRNKLS